MKVISLRKLFAVIGMLALFGCAPSTKYQSVQNTKLSSFFSVQDQQSLLSQVSQKLVTDPNLRSRLHNKKPTLLISKIINKTSEHIDTQSITDTLQTTILSNNLFNIVSRDNMNILAKEQKLNALGLTEKDKATQLGKLWGVKYVLYGHFSSIVNYVSGSKNTYYKLTIFLQNIENGMVIWAGEASVNKVTD